MEWGRAFRYQGEIRRGPPRPEGRTRWGRWAGMMERPEPQTSGPPDGPCTVAEVVERAGRGPTVLVGADLEEADFRGLDLCGWRFERCGFRNAAFDGADLREAAFDGCRGAGASFVAARLGEARFVASDFNNAAFRMAELGEARFERCKLTGADFTEARALDVAFDETVLAFARLPKLSFRRQTLVRVDFSEADLRKCDFRQAVLEECSLRNALLGESRFEGADLRSADLGGLKLDDARLFRGAMIARHQAAALLAQLGLVVVG